MIGQTAIKALFLPNRIQAATTFDSISSQVTVTPIVVPNPNCPSMSCGMAQKIRKASTVKSTDLLKVTGTAGRRLSQEELSSISSGGGGGSSGSSGGGSVGGGGGIGSIDASSFTSSSRSISWSGSNLGKHKQRSRPRLSRKGSVGKA